MSQLAKEKLLRVWEAIPPRFWAGFVLSLVLLCTLRVQAWYLKVGHVADAQSFYTFITGNTSANALIALAGKDAALREDDVTTYNEETATLQIDRAFPVDITVDGETLPINIATGTVTDALKKAKIVLDTNDYTVPAAEIALTEGMMIAVHRVVFIDSETTEIVPFETEYKYEEGTEDALMARAHTTVQGVDGVYRVVTREIIEDGVSQGTTVLAGVYDPAPVTQVITVKHAESISPLEAPAGITVNNHVPSSYSKVLTGRATGYSSRGGKGASGLGLYVGTFACNPNIIPYGTKVYITSADGKFVYGWAIATDTGTALMRGHVLVDLFYDSYEDSALNGVKQVNVYIP